MVALDGQTGAALRAHAHSGDRFSGLGFDHRMLQPAQQRLCLIKLQAERAGLEAFSLETGTISVMFACSSTSV